MKRLLSIIAALGLSAGAVFAANEYDATINNGVVTVTDFSYCGTYRYKLEFNQSGLATNGSYAGTTYQSRVTLYLNTESASIAGTFNLTNGGIDKDMSFIYYSAGSPTDRYFMDFSSSKITEITIKDLGDGKYSLEGWLRSNPKSNYYYYYTYVAEDNIFTITPGDPYVDEPSGQKTKDIKYSNLYVDSSDGATPIALYAFDEVSYDDILLLFNVSEFYIPAGEYSFSNSGQAGTIQVSNGALSGYYYTGSWVSSYPSWDETITYFPVAGTLTVSYAEGKIRISGTAATAHGSTLDIDLSGDSPFVEPEPEIYELAVSEVGAVFADDGSYFGLSIDAKNGNDACYGYVAINSSKLVGEYDYQDFRQFCYFGSTTNYIEGSDVENAASIVATGNANEYKLNLRISLQDGNIYIIRDAIFSYLPPSPYAAEPAASDFTVVFAAEPYIYEYQDTILLEFNNSDFDCISLAFAASSKDEILPCRYLVDTTLAAGTVVASRGTAGDYETPSFYAKAIGMTGYYPYYITQGYMDVAYEGEMLYITGVVTTSKGSNITLDISGKNTLTAPAALPANMLEGYVDGCRYLLAYDITTTADGRVDVAVTLWTDGTIAGLKPQAVIGGVVEDMAYDPSVCACSLTSQQKYERGEKLAVSIILGYEGGAVETRSIEYVVE